MRQLVFEDLTAICGAPPVAQRFVGPLNKYAFDPRFEVNSLERMAMFLGQVAHESDGFTAVREEASGQAYEGRKDLGNVIPGDGVRFKGRGLIQVTGRNGYKDISMKIYSDTRLLTHPELMEQSDNAVLSAFLYWSERDLNKVADIDPAHVWNTHVSGKPWSGTTYQWLTELINGGQNGYARRLKYYEAALKTLSAPSLVVGDAEPVQPTT